MSPSILVEICVDSVESALAAVQGGANRLELCANLALGGGTTPTLGMYRAVRRIAGDAAVMVMIRPRTGDFLYTPDEIIVMLEDIRSFKEAGVDGLVFGALTKDGRVDIRTTSRLVNEARPLQVCFHRAFDMTRNPLEALQDLQSIEGITRILTSGHGKTAPSSLTVLISLLRGSCSETHPPLTILPGSGINPNTVGSLVKALTPHGLREIHLSAGGWVPGEMEYKKDGMGMGIGGEGEWGIWRTSEEAVRWVRRIVDETIQ